MTCCAHCQDATTFFDRKTAERELGRYRRNGPPHKSTRLLLGALKTLDLRNKTLLDIGGGVGMIQHELLQEGLSRSTLVEASPAYIEAAREEGKRQGFSDRTSYSYGDFVELAPEMPTADLVTLDRVICCYPHMKRLVRASTEKARTWYGVVYPKERWYNRYGIGFVNVYCRLRGIDFRVYVHTAVDHAIQAQNFAPVYQRETILWTVRLYMRENS